MGIFDRYVFKNISLATIFVTIILSVIILLTQSLKFLELVIDSGADSWSFWILTFLALPRFFEVILPLALMASVLFTYNRMTMDSEMVVIRASGFSPLKLARPAIILSMFVCLILWSITMWASPKTLSGMNEMRQIVKAKISTMMLRDGIFTQATRGLTIYVHDRLGTGEMNGLMIYDSRNPDQPPVTVVAKRGILVSGEHGNQVIVYEGVQSQMDKKNNRLKSLNFERYTIDFPKSDKVIDRWSEPDERTIIELLNPDMSLKRDRDSLHDFRVEIHRRIAAPFLAIVFALISCTALLLGSVNRRGQGRRIMIAVLCITIIQGGFMTLANMARLHDLAIWGMYALVFLPLCLTFFLLSGRVR